jgi:hypothetical protein
MPIGTTNSLAQAMAEAARLTVERQDEFLVAVAARYYASRVGVPVGFSDSELRQLMAEAARLPVEDCGAFLVAVAARYYASIDLATSAGKQSSARVAIRQRRDNVIPPLMHWLPLTRKRCP